VGVSEYQLVAAIALVELLLSTKQADPNANISLLETDIDRLDYALYGLTEEKIDYDIKYRMGLNGEEADADE